MDKRLIDTTVDAAHSYLESLAGRRVGPTDTPKDAIAAFDEPFPEGPQDPTAVIDELVHRAERGLTATPGPRFFGFVIGGSLPVAFAADWLATAWDQNAGIAAIAPAASAAEEVAGRWLIELFGFPATASFAFVTGGAMANFTGLAAARNHVLAEAGWDVEASGLFGAPDVAVFVGEERHVTVDVALRHLGFGSARSRIVAADDQGRMKPDALARALDEWRGPAIVCAQAGNVNTGSLDPFEEICDAAGGRAWVHVDGAFGLWAAASPRHAHRVKGVEKADSWATDAHKWLNVPYDCGLVFTSHPKAHRAAMSVVAPYLIHQEGENGPRDAMDWSPEFSRRARGFPVYAAIKSLGRSGIAEMVERCCGHAQRFAELLAAGGAEICNDVVLNQVLVSFGDDDTTRRVVAGIQEEGTCWMGTTTWRGRVLMRISVSNWSTTDEDVERSVEAILKVAAGV